MEEVHLDNRTICMIKNVYRGNYCLSIVGPICFTDSSFDLFHSITAVSLSGYITAGNGRQPADMPESRTTKSQ